MKKIEITRDHFTRTLRDIDEEICYQAEIIIRNPSIGVSRLKEWEDKKKKFVSRYTYAR
jgi:hypothetical protein